MEITLEITGFTEVFDLDVLEASIIDDMNELLEAVKTEDFEPTVSEWSEENTPEFEIEKAHKEQDGTITGAVTTDDELYVGLNNGMPAHPIDASPGKVLIFQEHYQRSTEPRTLSSGQALSSGRWIRKQHVDHQGTTPGEWDIAAALKRGNSLQPIAIKAIKKSRK